MRPDAALFRMDQERHASVGFGAHQLYAALGLAPTADDDVLQFFMQERFARLFPGRIGDFDEVRQHAGGLESVDLPVLDLAVNKRFTDSVVYARCERISSSESRRAFCLENAARSSSSFWRDPPRASLPRPSDLLPRAGVVGQRFQLQLLRGKLGGELRLHLFQAGQIAGSRRLLPSCARRIALDRRQIFVDLRQLIAQTSKLRPAAAAPAWRAVSSPLSRSRRSACKASRSEVFARIISRSASPPAPLRRRSLGVNVQFGLFPFAGALQFLRFRLARSQTLADRTDLLGLQFQPAAGSLGFEIQLGHFLRAPRSARLRCDNRSPAVALCSPSFSCTARRKFGELILAPGSNRAPAWRLRAPASGIARKPPGADERTISVRSSS